jgi:hypothetical protein
MIYIYFVQAGETGPIKIGCSQSPRNRLGELQIAHYKTLRLLGWIEHSDILENQLHIEFEDDRIRGEWFHPTKQVINKITELLDGKLLKEALPVLPLKNLKLPPPRPVDDLHSMIDQETGSTLGAAESQGKQSILAALKHTNGNITKAAKFLCIARRTLQDRMRRYGIPRGRSGHPVREFVV